MIYGYLHTCVFFLGQITAKLKCRDWLSKVAHYQGTFSSIFRKDDNGEAKWQGALPPSLQQWFVFLIAWSEVSFVSVRAASLYLDEDINPGGTRRNAAHRLCLVCQKQTVRQPETEINVNLPNITVFFRKQSFISLSYLDRGYKWIPDHKKIENMLLLHYVRKVGRLSFGD